MRKKSYILTIAAVLAIAVVYLTILNPVLAGPPSKPPGRGGGDLGVVYVVSQGLYYDTFVSAETLPPHGRFQLLEDGETYYGPGDPGYLGGRWKIPNPEAEDGYDYLLCPLLPPGRETP